VRDGRLWRALQTSPTSGGGSAWADQPENLVRADLSTLLKVALSLSKGEAGAG